MVFIQVKKPKWYLLGLSRRFIGSGVIIDQDGYIVTNHHVIDGAAQIKVALNNNDVYTAQLVGQDRNTDLAVLKIEATHLPYLPFGDSDALRIGEEVLALGSPYGLRFTVTKGIVSAKARNVRYMKRELGAKLPVEALIQIDAAINPGNSGGALVAVQKSQATQKEEVALVGINSARLPDSPGICFAIPASIAQRVTEDLRAYRTVHRAMLGICVDRVSAELAHAKGLPKVSGVCIARIWRAGAAEKAGLQKGDIIVAIDGHEITSTPQFLEWTLHYKPRDTVRVAYYRGGTRSEVRVTLQSRNE
ncbi:MAG: trypsin-like peptidase domain-containing protein [Roseivirga sp.]